MYGKKGRGGGFEFKLGFRFSMRTVQNGCRDAALFFFFFFFLLFFIRANKNSRLPTPCNLLLPHLGFWSPSTAHTGQSAAASHSPGTTADSYHPRTPQYVKAEERNLDVSCSKEEEEKIHKATLTGIILSTRMISLSFLGGLRKCETFK